MATHGFRDRLVADPGCERSPTAPCPLPPSQGRKSKQRTPPTTTTTTSLDCLVSHSCPAARPSTKLLIPSLPSPARDTLGGPCRKPAAALLSQCCRGFQGTLLGFQGDAQATGTNLPAGPTSLEDDGCPSPQPATAGIPGLAFVGRGGGGSGRERSRGSSQARGSWVRDSDERKRPFSRVSSLAVVGQRPWHGKSAGRRVFTRRARRQRAERWEPVAVAGTGGCVGEALAAWKGAGSAACR